MQLEKFQVDILKEARPTESETLISRLIDRPIRPLFPDEFKNEVQLLPTVISYDKEMKQTFYLSLRRQLH